MQDHLADPMGKAKPPEAPSLELKSIFQKYIKAVSTPGIWAAKTSHDRILNFTPKDAELWKFQLPADMEQQDTSKWEPSREEKHLSGKKGLNSTPTSPFSIYCTELL